MWNKRDNRINSGDVSTREFIINSLIAFIHSYPMPPIPKDINWTKFNDITHFQKLQPIYFNAIDHSDVPPFVRESLKHNAFTTWRDNSLAIRDTCWLFNLLEETSVPAVVLRGLSISLLYYPDFSLRPMTDVDILIPPKYANFVYEQLKHNGILPSKDYFSREKLVYCIGDTLFEIHWSFITPKRYRHIREFDYWIDYRKKIKVQNGFFYVLTPEDEFIGQAVHGFTHHNYQRIFHLLDISFIIKRQDLDWHYIENWFARNKLTNLFSFTLSYLQYLLQMEVSEKSTNERWVNFFEAYYIPSLGKDSFTFHLKRSIFQLFAAEHTPTKIKQIFRLFSFHKLSYFSFLLYNRNRDIYVGRSNKIYTEVDNINNNISR